MKLRKFLFLAGIFTALFFMLFSACSDDPPPIVEEPKSDLLILQVYGSTGSNGAVSHNFVELYNPQNETVILDGLSLQYATSNADETLSWIKIDLKGTVGARSSFLVLGAKRNPNGIHQIPDDYGDMIINGMLLNNRGFSVALMSNTNLIMVQNPFNIDGNGTILPGLIDLVGAQNAVTDTAWVSKTNPGRNSHQEALRRISLTDTGNNAADFISVRYQLISNGALELYKPRNNSYGAWDPVSAAPPALFILQAYGSGTGTGGSVSHDFIELYNNTKAPINLNTYSVQFADGIDTNITGVTAATPDSAWTKIDLTGHTIPARRSFLILGPRKQNTSPGLVFENNDGDIIAPNLSLSNRAYKIALMSNQNLLTVTNPFNIADGVKAPGYVDMVGVINSTGRDHVRGFETQAFDGISAQNAARRMNPVDSDNNAADFTTVDYRLYSGSNGTAPWRLPMLQPKNSSFGPYTLGF
jgi:hypothetical protein